MNPPSRQPVDLSRLKTWSIGQRAHQVAVEGLAGLPPRGASFGDWWAALPHFLGATQLRAAVEAILAARRAERPVVMALGAHVVKVGCSPIVVDLLRRGLITDVALNGATAIHDVELALFGETSEEVSDTLRDGRFGMVRETAEFFAEALALPDVVTKTGLGAALGDLLRRRGAPHAAHSILAAAHEHGAAATVHVALGTDTIHVHPNVDAGRLGAASGLDFRIACAVVCRMAAPRGKPGGVWCNVGSAVVLPEVFLKAVAVARNLGHDLDGLRAVNLDMTRQYRPGQNVIGRPVAAGCGHEIIGHHELLLPLLRQALIEQSAP